jgi:aryl-alcohol dehydrogenase-like predicted oxidoreductase
MIPKYPFGRTGHKSTRTLFGAAALGRVTQDEADRTLELILKHGINHIDTAASYGGAEIRIGPWMQEHRKTFFLATKTGERTYQAARDEIHRSLERMRVDSIDLIQLHNLVNPDEWEVAMGPDGALKAAIEARDQGIVRFIGITGHGLTVAARHLQSLKHFEFDSVLLPYNYIMAKNPQYRADFEALYALCKKRGVAIQTIKSLLRRPWGERPQDRATWYQPLEDQKSIDTAVHWVLGCEGIFLNTVGDIHLLPLVLKAASRYRVPATDGAMENVLDGRQLEPLFTE